MQGKKTKDLLSSVLLGNRYVELYFESSRQASAERQPSKNIESPRESSHSSRHSENQRDNRSRSRSKSFDLLFVERQCRFLQVNPNMNNQTCACVNRDKTTKKINAAFWWMMNGHYYLDYSSCVYFASFFLRVRTTIEKHSETHELFCDIFGSIFRHSELFLCVLSLLTNENWSYFVLLFEIIKTNLSVKPYSNHQDTDCRSERRCRFTGGVVPSILIITSFSRSVCRDDSFSWSLWQSDWL